MPRQTHLVKSEVPRTSKWQTGLILMLHLPIGTECAFSLCTMMVANSDPLHKVPDRLGRIQSPITTKAEQSRPRAF
jgi:hypothetical protein